ncbi:MAG: ATP-binding protein [Planctomycetia bacterium]
MNHSAMPDDKPPAEPLPADPAALLEAVLKTAGDYIVIVDRRLAIRYVNRVGSGFTPEQVVGRNVLEFTIDGTAERLRSTIEAAFATGATQTIHTRVMTPAGPEEYAVHVGPVHAADGVAAVVVCCEDISSLRASERNLERKRLVLRRLIDIQERERQLVSYDIHDGLTQYLTAAMLHLEACEHAASGIPALAGDLREGLRLLRAATDEARRLISGLRPPALDELGIVEAVESLVGESRADVPNVAFSHDLPAGRLPADVETTVFRIVQESLSNVRRHARAKAASIRLESPDARTVRIVVHDDGVGFDPAHVPHERFGIEGIRQRASLIGGTASITSRPGRGTTVLVTLPLEHPLADEPPGAAASATTPR